MILRFAAIPTEPRRSESAANGAFSFVGSVVVVRVHFDPLARQIRNFHYVARCHFYLSLSASSAFVSASFAASHSGFSTHSRSKPETTVSSCAAKITSSSSDAPLCPNATMSCLFIIGSAFINHLSNLGKGNLSRNRCFMEDAYLRFQF